MNPPPPIAMNSVGAVLAGQMAQRGRETGRGDCQLAELGFDLLGGRLDGLVDVIVAQSDPGKCVSDS